MDEHNEPTNQVITSKKESGHSILEHPLMKEIGIPLVRQAVKKELGIETHEKEITKKSFGRFMYAMRDFIQGTWWVAVIFTFSMGITVIILLWLRKAFGV